MKTVPVTSANLKVVFRPGSLPQVDPANPTFTLTLGGFSIDVRINAKSARKLAVHRGGAILQGRLVESGDRLQLVDAGFSWLEPTEPKLAEPVLTRD